MTTTPATPPQPVTPQHPRSSRNTVGIILAIFGGVILVVVLLSLVFRVITVPQSSQGQQVNTNIQGITAIDLDMSAGELTIEYGEVSGVQLDITNPRGDWRMDRTGDTLVIRSPKKPFFFFFGFNGWERHERVILTLPAALEGKLDAKLSLSAGSITSHADFKSLDVDLSAGYIEIAGEMSQFSGEVSAGDLRGELSNVTKAELDVSAGSSELRFTGSAPEELEIDLTAGDATVILPDVVYDVRADRTAGDIITNVRTERGSKHFIDVTVTAGSVTLKN